MRIRRPGAQYPASCTRTDLDTGRDTSYPFGKSRKQRGATMPVSVEQVTSKKQLKEFVMFPYRLYRTDKNWVPQLLMDDYKKLDRKKNPFFRACGSRVLPCAAGRRGGGPDRLHPRQDLGGDSRGQERVLGMVRVHRRPRGRKGALHVCLRLGQKTRMRSDHRPHEPQRQRSHRDPGGGLRRLTGHPDALQSSLTTTSSSRDMATGSGRTSSRGSWTIRTSPIGWQRSCRACRPRAGSRSAR